MSAPLSPEALVKGWCPGALRPMLSGDGLIVRVRPQLARLTRDQVLGLCDAALAHGSGMIDLTSRANVQIRGVQEAGFAGLMAQLGDLGLLDGSEAAERARSVLCVPTWQAGDLTTRLHADLMARLDALPVLPAKMGIALDAGDGPMLSACSADFRFERGETSPLILRADGVELGRRVDESDAIAALIEMMAWFTQTGGLEAKRMAKHVARAPLPDVWMQERPAPHSATMQPGKIGDQLVLGAPFGRLDAKALRSLMEESGASAMRVTPWRLFALEGAGPVAADDFITCGDDPALRTHACPGKPYCPSATVETRDLALRLAAQTQQTLHVSGCAKGCALPRKAAITLTGRDGCYDLIRNGEPWAVPERNGLAADMLEGVLDS